MRITDLLKPQSIDLNAVVADKPAAVERLVDLMEAGGNLADKALYKARVLAREAEGSTGIGEGIAIPHAKTEAVKAPGLASMIVRAGRTGIPVFPDCGPRWRRKCSSGSIEPVEPDVDGR